MSKKGFGLIWVMVTIVVALVLILVAIVFVLKPNTRREGTNSSNSGKQNVTWIRFGNSWKSIGTPPDCPNPLMLQPPVDISQATSVLYPGQLRGGNYKAHGGFRFDNASENAVEVHAPLDAQISAGSRYIEQGEVQYMFTFTNPCGIMYRFDHLNTLSPKLQALADQLPVPKMDDSRDSPVSGTVSQSELIAAKIGFTSTKNASVDFGVYDLRQKNAASADASWASQHDPELAQHAVCWFDLLPPTDAAKVKSLPAGDQQSGKTSDYCK